MQSKSSQDIHNKASKTDWSRKREKGAMVLEIREDFEICGFLRVVNFGDGCRSSEAADSNNLIQAALLFRVRADANKEGYE